MSLSRKRRRELRKLRSQAQDLLDQQRVVLSQAGTVLHEAGRQAKQLNDEHVMPRVRPAVDEGVRQARRAADSVRRFSTPIIAGALANTVRTLERLENQQAAESVRSFGVSRGLLEAPKKKRGIGGIVALVVGVTAAAGVGYVLWQALRDDDELWVAPEGY